MNATLANKRAFSASSQRRQQQQLNTFHNNNKKNGINNNNLGNQVASTMRPRTCSGERSGNGGDVSLVSSVVDGLDSLFDNGSKNEGVASSGNKANLAAIATNNNNTTKTNQFIALKKSIERNRDYDQSRLISSQVEEPFHHFRARVSCRAPADRSIHFNRSTAAIAEAIDEATEREQVDQLLRESLDTFQQFGYVSKWPLPHATRWHKKLSQYLSSLTSIEELRKRLSTLRRTAPTALSVEEAICALADAAGSVGEVVEKLKFSEYYSELKLVSRSLHVKKMVCDIPGGEILYEYNEYQPAVITGSGAVCRSGHSSRPTSSKDGGSSNSGNLEYGGGYDTTTTDGSSSDYVTDPFANQMAELLPEVVAHRNIRKLYDMSHTSRAGGSSRLYYSPEQSRKAATSAASTTVVATESMTGSSSSSSPQKIVNSTSTADSNNYATTTSGFNSTNHSGPSSPSSPPHEMFEYYQRQQQQQQRQSATEAESAAEEVDKTGKFVTLHRSKLTSASPYVIRRASMIKLSSAPTTTSAMFTSNSSADLSAAAATDVGTNLQIDPSSSTVTGSGGGGHHHHRALSIVVTSSPNSKRNSIAAVTAASAAQRSHYNTRSSLRLSVIQQPHHHHNHTSDSINISGGGSRSESFMRSHSPPQPSHTGTRHASTRQQQNNNNMLSAALAAAVAAVQSADATSQPFAPIAEREDENGYNIYDNTNSSISNYNTTTVTNTQNNTRETNTDATASNDHTVQKSGNISNNDDISERNNKSTGWRTNNISSKSRSNNISMTSTNSNGSSSHYSGNNNSNNNSNNAIIKQRTHRLGSEGMNLALNMTLNQLRQEQDAYANSPANVRAIRNDLRSGKLTVTDTDGDVSIGSNRSKDHPLLSPLSRNSTNKSVRFGHRSSGDDTNINDGNDDDHNSRQSEDEEQDDDDDGDGGGVINDEQVAEPVSRNHVSLNPWYNTQQQQQQKGSHRPSTVATQQQYQKLPPSQQLQQQPPLPSVAATKQVRSRPTQGSFRIAGRIQDLFDAQAVDSPFAVMCRRDALKAEREELLLRSDKWHIRAPIEKRGQVAQQYYEQQQQQTL